MPKIASLKNFDLNKYYIEIPTDDFTKSIMPEILNYLCEYYGLTVNEIAVAVSKTSSDDYSMKSFLDNLQIDFSNFEKDWRKHLQRNLNYKLELN